MRFDFKENQIELGTLSTTGLLASLYNVILCESSIVPADFAYPLASHLIGLRVTMCHLCDTLLETQLYRK